MKTIVRVLIVMLVGFACRLPAEEKTAVKPGVTVSLPALLNPELVQIIRSLAVQESGRIKPLDTVARFTLLKFSGKQTIALTNTGSTAGGIGQSAPVPLNDPATGKPIFNDKGKPVRASATEWMMLCWFRPDIARMIPVFIVDNTDAIRIPGKVKRDRYSFEEIERWGLAKPENGGKSPLEEVEDLRDKKPDEYSPEERSLVKLYEDFRDCQKIINHGLFARGAFGDVAADLPEDLRKEWTSSNQDLLAFLPKVIDYYREHPDEREDQAAKVMRQLEQTWHGALMARNPANVLRIFPPDSKDVEIWEGPGTIMQTAMRGEKISESMARNFAGYRELLAADDASVLSKARAFSESVSKAAADRSETKFIGLEVSYHKTEYFYQALLYFFGALLVVALSWLAPRSVWGRWCSRIGMVLLLVGAVYSVSGIVVRCIIMQRPPITTLYETIIFIGSAAVVFGLVTEWITRKGIALAMACLAGTAGMFLSLRFMNMESTDTLRQLEAVLITTFWLATHVPIINLGYAAGMVAAIFAMFYFVLRFLVLIGLLKADQSAVPSAIRGLGFGFFNRSGKPPADQDRDLIKFRDLNRIAYAFVCAGLFLSLVGTVLGGIWANYSWGRFWGWDPKENGALMIVLMNLVILHSRIGGYIREVGLHALCLILGMITVFSWFGTNQLGIGLHAYGQIGGVWWWIYMFWASQLLLLLFALFLAWWDRGHKHHEATGHGPGQVPQES